MARSKPQCTFRVSTGHLNDLVCVRTADHKGEHDLRPEGFDPNPPEPK